MEIDIISLLTFITAMAIVGTLCAACARLGWPFELATHFRVQYLLALLFGAAGFLLAHRPLEAAVAALFALLNAIAVLPLYRRGAAVQRGARTLRVLMMNVQCVNAAHERVRRVVESSDPDILLVVEYTPAWHEALRPLAARYPHAQHEARDGGYGIALWSRIPFADASVQQIGSSEMPSVIARFEFHGRPVTLIGTHPRSPKNRAASVARNHQLAELARHAALHEGEVLMVGDLNTSPWSPTFRDLLRDSGLRDGRIGHGIQPTWPALFPPLWTPIDHCLVSRGLRVARLRRGPHVGSDHFPVLADIHVSSF